MEAEGGGLALTMMLTSKDLVLVNLPGNTFPISILLLLLCFGPMISAPGALGPKAVSQ